MGGRPPGPEGNIARELADAVDDERDEATAKALASARAKLAEVAPMLGALIEAMRPVDHSFAQMWWCSQPSSTFRDAPVVGAADVTQTLVKVQSMVRRMLPDDDEQ
jgi:hypothetical protein